jgi:hypothetical protein
MADAISTLIDDWLCPKAAIRRRDEAIRSLMLKMLQAAPRNCQCLRPAIGASGRAQSDDH